MSTIGAASNATCQEVLHRGETASFWYRAYAEARQEADKRKQQIEKLEAELEWKNGLVEELLQKIEALKFQLVWMAKQIFGRKSEASQPETADPGDTCEAGNQKDNSAETVSSDSPQGDSQDNKGTERKKRGKREGSKGYGRKLRKNLPFVEVICDLPDERKLCPKCQLPLVESALSEASEVIDWEVRIVRRVYRRKCYTPTCCCGAVPGVVTADPVAKLIPKGMFTALFWVRLILEKFLFQRPLYRIRKALALEGLGVSQGTLTGGLKKIHALIEPLYNEVIQRSRQAKHWKMDETRWMVFVEVAGKVGYRWWLWVVVTRDTVLYYLDPSRSSKVPKKHLGDARGILNVDRYSAYKTLLSLIRLAFCWVHQRRDFIRIRDGYYHSRLWAIEWIERIDALFRLNDQRLACRGDPQAFQIRQQKLKEAANNMADIREKQLSDPGLRRWERSALESMKNHWQGLTIFVDNPDVPMDNNESERWLRGPVCGRKNYYGCGSEWSGALTAMLFTILQTCCVNRIDPQKMLLAYFEACAENGGKAPQDVSGFLPWNLSAEDRQAWHLGDAFP